METLKNYVNWKLAHSDKTATAEGYPLVMENCKTGKRMKQLEVYGNCLQSQTPSPDNPSEIQSVGDLITDTGSEYYGKYKIPITVRGKNLFDKDHALVFNGYFSGGKIVNYNPTVSDLAIICISCKPNTSYTISRQIQSKRFRFASSTMPPGTDTILNTFSAYDNQMNGIITTGENDIYLYVWFYNKTVDIGYTYQEIMNGIQIEEGVIATEYEPHIEPITQNIYLDEPLRKVGDYADYIDFKNQKVVRKVKEEDISCQLPKTLAKTTIIEVGTSLEPSNIKGKYIIK